jgi:hypothetical protein
MPWEDLPQIESVTQITIKTLNGGGRIGLNMKEKQVVANGIQTPASKGHKKEKKADETTIKACDVWGARIHAAGADTGGEPDGEEGKHELISAMWSSFTCFRTVPT